MGYETRLHIGIEYDIANPERTISEIARVDLSKVGYSTRTGKVLADARKSDEHFTLWADNGNDRITEDRYGDALTAVDMDELIDAMHADNVEEPYRRFTVALALLTAIRNDPEWDYDRDRIRVVQYGH